MKNVILKSNIYKFGSTLINFSIKDTNRKAKPFDVIEVTKMGTQFMQCLMSELGLKGIPFFQYGIRIRTLSLNVGETYFIEFNKHLNFYDSDEYVYTYNYSIDNNTFFVTFPDLNYHGYFEKDLNLCNTENLVPYTIEMLSSKKFALHINNKKATYAYFSICWIESVNNNLLDNAKQTLSMGNDWFVECAFENIRNNV